MSRARISDRERFFRELNLWPHVLDFNVEAWLQNFSQEEQFVAERLLLGFCYFNERMTDALFRTALQNQLMVANRDSILKCSALEVDIDDIAFVVCEGEDPHPTDSGNLFSRKLRDRFEVPESRIMSPKKALTEADSVRYFIFLTISRGAAINSLIQCVISIMVKAISVLLCFTLLDLDVLAIAHV